MFDKSLTTRFEKNKTNTDSVLVIVSEAFRNGDNFLKNEKRNTDRHKAILQGDGLGKQYVEIFN